MADIMKRYRNKSGYTIKATPKAYNLFYKKQGFLPVDESTDQADGKKAADDELTEKDPADSEAAPKEPAKKGKGKSAKAADKASAETEAPAESSQEE